MAQTLPIAGPVAGTGAETSTTEVEVTWSSVTYPSDGATTPTGYELWGDGGSTTRRRRLQAADDYSGFSLIATYGPEVTSARITTGITPLATYRFAIKQLNAFGTGPFGPIISIIAAGLPGRPTNLQLTSADLASITFSWSAPADDGGATITDYAVQ